MDLKETDYNALTLKNAVEMSITVTQTLYVPIQSAGSIALAELDSLVQVLFAMTSMSAHCNCNCAIPMLTVPIPLDPMTVNVSWDGQEMEGPVLM